VERLVPSRWILVWVFSFEGVEQRLGTSRSTLRQSVWLTTKCPAGARCAFRVQRAQREQLHRREKRPLGIAGEDGEDERSGERIVERAVIGTAGGRALNGRQRIEFALQVERGDGRLETAAFEPGMELRGRRAESIQGPVHDPRAGRAKSGEGRG